MKKLMILIAIVASYLAVSNEVYALTLPEAMAMSDNNPVMAREMLADNKKFIDSRCGTKAPKASAFNSKATDWANCVMGANFSYPSVIIGLDDTDTEGFYLTPKSEWHTPTINLGGE